MFYACYALQKNFCYKLFWHEQQKCINLYRLMAKILIVHFQFLRQINNSYRPHPLSPQPENTDVTHKKINGRLGDYFHVHKDSQDRGAKVKKGNQQ